MVIILQQTTENGNRFVSTVVDTPPDSSFNSNFSYNSQLSISERSAAYKQRIDSLFGRPSRLSSFNASAEPFRIRIDGKSVSPTEALMGSNRTGLSSVTATVSTALRQNENEGRILSTSEDDEYTKINDKSSVMTDSLNHQLKIASKQGNGQNGNNVSSVRITCDDSESSGSQLQSLMLTSSSSGEEIVGRIEENSDQIMWRNSNYGESSSSPANAGSRNDKLFSTVRCSPGGMLKFSVEYLGSVPVKGNTAALQDLQAPLRSLYMRYLTSKNMMPGQLAITSDGLRFEAPKIRLVNPFTTIAVWAAVKFVGRGEPAIDCAFMPLISDPEGQDKSRLFGKMDSDLALAYQNCIADGSKHFKNPPIFACVMREASFSLDCHAFACKCAEDAIVIAANLYQSLVDKMRSGKEGESGYGSLTRISPATQSSMNQNRSSSSASSSAASPSKGISKNVVSITKNILIQTPSTSSTQNDSRAVFSDSESIAPIRPPRRKKKASEIPPGNLKRYNSDDSVLLNLPSRRRSFKASYQGHYIKHKKRVQIHTPDESSSGDSLSDSVDQILDRIVNPCGMSFNDLKPAYQELILKIALTLTQDQLYKKSKQAMKKQQQQQQKSRKKLKTTCSSAEASDDNTQFMNQFLKSISKMASSSKGNGNAKRAASKPPISASALNAKQAARQLKPIPKIPKPSPSKAILKKTKEDDIPFMSFCSGCVCDKCSDKCYCSLPSKHVANGGGCMAPTPTSSTTVTSTPTQHPICSSTADTDVPRSRKSCGYDTDSCAESEKCYCSLQRVKSNGLKIYNINLDTETSDTDTNSYDLEPFNNPQLSENSVIPKSGQIQRPVEILSYHPSRRLSYCFSPTTSQKSYVKGASPALPTEPEKRCDKSNHSSSSKVSKKYREINILETTPLSKNKVLLITGSNASGQVVYKDSPFNFRQGLDFGDGLSRRIEHNKISSKQDHISPETNKKFESPCSSSSPDKKPEFAPEKVLSMKKTAEIAAMFTDLKLDQTQGFTNNGISDAEEMKHQESMSVDFETSLGYLP